MDPLSLPESERTGGRSEGREAILRVSERQRLLRSVYASARYGWPEALACEWQRQPQRFVEEEPPCRASRFLEAFTSPDALR